MHTILLYVLQYGWYNFNISGFVTMQLAPFLFHHPTIP